jgi:hypothetical protein
MPNDFAEVKSIDKALITGGIFSASIGIKESLGPVLRKGMETVLPNLTSIARVNSSIGTGFIMVGIVGVVSGIGDLIVIKLLLRSEKNQKVNDTKNISEKNNK